MILIHQMAKVASQSWVEAAKLAAATESSLPIHCHYVVPCNRERMKAVFSLPAPQQTIANMLIPRDLLRVGASVWGQIESARQRQEKIRVVSGMRDPVARSISLIVYLCDFYGHVSRPLSPRTAVSPDYVIGALQENWRLVLERKEPGQTFEWLLWYSTDAFRSWFADELGAAFGVDVLQGEFRRQESMQRMSAPLSGHFYLSRRGYVSRSSWLCSPVGASQHVSGNHADGISERQYQLHAPLARTLRGGAAAILATR